MRAVKLFWSVFGLASFVAVALGAATMAQAGLPAGTWLRNPVAWCVGAGIAGWAYRAKWSLKWVAPVAVALVAATFLGGGQDGVHRWIGLGPVQLNAAALVLPIAIAGVGDNRWLNAICLALATGLLATQPDMSQLIALSATGSVLATFRYGFRGFAFSVVVAAAAIAFCMARPDPLMPVAHVEGILNLASAKSQELSNLMGAAVLLAAFSPVMLWVEKPLRARALALFVYFTITATAWVWVAFPVPLAGYGVSFVLGWWLGVAALLTSSASTDSPSR